jgi:hypothetical protein
VTSSPSLSKNAEPITGISIVEKSLKSLPMSFV